MCGATPTAIRAIAFDLDSRSFLCEATPSLTCFVRFDNKSFRLRFEGEHLTTAAVGSAVGMRGADFGIEKSLCQESR